jgi:hypothetical protein
MVDRKGVEDVLLIWCAPEAADGARRGRVGGCAGE